MGNKQSHRSFILKSKFGLILTKGFNKITEEIIKII